MNTKPRAVIEQERKLRKQIVELMKIRATLTSRRNAAEWQRVDRQITTLQRQIDRCHQRQ